MSDGPRDSGLSFVGQWLRIGDGGSASVE